MTTTAIKDDFLQSDYDLATYLKKILITKESGSGRGNLFYKAVEQIPRPETELNYYQFA